MPERGRDVGEVGGITSTIGDGGSSVGGRSCFGRDSDRRVRREIANSNERRRMQSINAGFQSLRKLLQSRDRDKLSKASVLQKAVEYIYSLEQDRSYLRACNARIMYRLQKALGHDICDMDIDLEFSNSESLSAIRCQKMDLESSDESIAGMLSPTRDDAVNDNSTSAIETLRKQVTELQHQLETERHARVIAEQRNVEVATSASNVRQDKLCSGSSTVGTSRRGSLETIVEAIHCLEGDAKTAVTTSAGVCLTTAASPLVKDELVVAAAEALQFIAARRHPTAISVSSSSSSPSWQRQRNSYVDTWTSCR